MEMAATALSFSLSLDSRPPLFVKARPQTFLSGKSLSVSCSPTSSYHTHPFLLLHQLHRLNSTLPCSTSHSSSSDSYLNNPLTTSRFLDVGDIERREILKQFSYSTKINSGSLVIRAMGDEEVDITVRLLAESFAESMLVPSRFLALLRFLVKQYVMERRSLLPNAATLIGFFEGEDGKAELAGTVEVSFNSRGANASTPTPLPPLDSPYICNMAVKKNLRRRGIGWHHLQASEQLISVMKTSGDVYLHCRMIDKIPFNMYKKAGYRVIKTDSILTLLTFQRRKYLMHKTLPELNTPTTDTLVPFDEQTS